MANLEAPEEKMCWVLRGKKAYMPEKNITEQFVQIQCRLLPSVCTSYHIDIAKGVPSQLGTG